MAHHSPQIFGVVNARSRLGLQSQESKYSSWLREQPTCFLKGVFVCIEFLVGRWENVWTALRSHDIDNDWVLSECCIQRMRNLVLKAFLCNANGQELRHISPETGQWDRYMSRRESPGLGTATSIGQLQGGAVKPYLRLQSEVLLVRTQCAGINLQNFNI
jgi:hypothetical protein